MRNLTSAFKEQLNKDNRKYLEWIDITLKDGTVLNLREDSIWNFGLKVEDAVSDSSEFKIGSAIINKATVTLNNIYDDFSDYDFEGAVITCYVGLRISPSGMESAIQVPWKDIDGNSILDIDGNEIYIKYDDAVIERIRLCTMNVVDAPYQNSSIITLTCQDNMMKFDRDYSESKLQYPATRNEIIRDACSVCGVPLQTVTFDNDDYVIQERPADDQLTFRQLISWVAQIGGQWCRCDSYGRLCVDWYDLKTYESDSASDSSYINISSYDSLSVYNEDVVITGIKVTEYIKDASSEKQATTYQYGKDGYVIEIKDNKLIAEGTGEVIATMIGERIVGMRFRPFSVSMMNNPAIEAGDICIVTDRKGNKYKSLITSSTFQVGNKQNVECGAKSAARNSSKQYSLFSQAVVENRKNMQNERKRHDDAIDNLSKRISQSTGLYTTVEKSDVDGNIYYLHNKATLAESDIVWKMTAEAWGVSTDGGKTWNGGMTVDGDTVVRILDAVGVRANWINTGEFRVADEDGNEVFYVNCDTGVVRIKAQQLSIVGVSVEEIANKEINKFVTNTYKTDLDEIKKQLSNKIETWYQDTDPSANWDKITEVVWCDVDGYPILDADGNKILTYYEESKAEHEGDLWKNSTNNNEYIYRSGKWELMEIPDSLFDEIDGKSQIFVNTPETPYDVGDTWFTGTSILVCKTKRVSGNFQESDWEKKDNYTDDSAVKNFIEKTYTPTISDIQNQIDGKIDTYYYDYEPTLSNIPASQWTTDAEKQIHNGDLFFWKSKGYTYRFLQVDKVWKWVRIKDEDISDAMTAASNAQDTADGKRRVFTATPVPPYDVGDLWTQGTNGDLMRCVVSRTSGNYVSSDWAKATKYTDDSAVGELEESVKSELEVLNNKIALRVTSSEAESLIEQKSKSIRLQADEIAWSSKYSSMTESGILTCQSANIKGTITSESGMEKVRMSAGENEYYYNSIKLGQIGTNRISGDNSKKGITFDLETAGSYMTWASRDSSNDNTYSMKMTYVRNSFSNFTSDAVNMGCTLDMRGYTLKNPSFEGGGLTGTSKTYCLPTAINSDGTVQSWLNGVYMQVRNGIIVNGAF